MECIHLFYFYSFNWNDQSSRGLFHVFWGLTVPTVLTLLRLSTVPTLSSGLYPHMSTLRSSPTRHEPPSSCSWQCFTPLPTKPWGSGHSTRKMKLKSYYAMRWGEIWQKNSSSTRLLVKLNGQRACENNNHTKRKLRVVSHLLYWSGAGLWKIPLMNRHHGPYYKFRSLNLLPICSQFQTRRAENKTKNTGEKQKWVTREQEESFRSQRGRRKSEKDVNKWKESTERLRFFSRISDGQSDDGEVSPWAIKITTIWPVCK